MKTTSRCQPVGLAMASLCLLAVGSPASAAGPIELGNGWKGSFDGMILGFVVQSFDSDATDEAEGFRVQSGFDPTKFGVTITAPEVRGLTASATYQFATAIQSDKSKLRGVDFETRIAELNMAGGFGTVKLGRSWNIFSSSSLIHGSGSLPGVGLLCTAPDGNTPTCGQIGVGYTWTAFSAGVQYASPKLGPMTLRAGVFDPIEVPFGGIGPSGGNPAIETPTPRAEGEWNLSVAASDAVGLDVWASGLYQQYAPVGGDGDIIAGFDAGAEIRLGPAALTGAFTRTEGAAAGFVGNGICQDDPGTESVECESAQSQMWFAEADITLGRAQLGGSYGQGADTAVGADTTTTSLILVFARYSLTDNTLLAAEFNHADYGEATRDLVALGAQFSF
jgi:hypothetical protein